MKHVALPLVCLDVKKLIYTRYWGLGEKKAFEAQVPLTQNEVEVLRTKPEILVPNEAA